MNDKVFHFSKYRKQLENPFHSNFLGFLNPNRVDQVQCYISFSF